MATKIENTLVLLNKAELSTEEINFIISSREFNEKNKNNKKTENVEKAKIISSSKENFVTEKVCHKNETINCLVYGELNKSIGHESTRFNAEIIIKGKNVNYPVKNFKMVNSGVIFETNALFAVLSFRIPENKWSNFGDFTLFINLIYYEYLNDKDFLNCNNCYSLNNIDHLFSMKEKHEIKFETKFLIKNPFKFEVKTKNFISSIFCDFFLLLVDFNLNYSYFVHKILTENKSNDFDIDFEINKTKKSKITSKNPIEFKIIFKNKQKTDSINPSNFSAEIPVVFRFAFSVAINGVERPFKIVQTVPFLIKPERTFSNLFRFINFPKNVKLGENFSADLEIFNISNQELNLFSFYSNEKINYDQITPKDQNFEKSKNLGIFEIFKKSEKSEKKSENLEKKGENLTNFIKIGEKNRKIDKNYKIFSTVEQKGLIVWGLNSFDNFEKNFINSDVHCLSDKKDEKETNNKNGIICINNVMKIGKIKPNSGQIIKFKFVAAKSGENSNGDFFIFDSISRDWYFVPHFKLICH